MSKYISTLYCFIAFVLQLIIHSFCINSLEPHAGFKIAFNMFDADGNQMVDKREFLVVSWLIVDSRCFCVFFIIILLTIIYFLHFLFSVFL